MVKQFKTKLKLELSEAYILTHGIDPDGWSSAAILDMALGNIPKYHFRHDYGYDHKKVLSKIPDGVTVFIADLSLPVDIFLNLCKRTEVYWFDHHETAFENAIGTELEKLPGVRVRKGTAACELVWNFFMDEPMPSALKLIGGYDVRNKDMLPEIDIFNIYIRDCCKLPNEVGWMDFWIDLFSKSEEEVNSIMNRVRNIYDHQINMDCTVAKAISFTTEFLGYSVIVANRSSIGSSFFESVVNDNHDFMISYYRTKSGLYKYTIFSNKEQCHAGNLAKKLFETYKVENGGGHAGAGGFMAKQDFDDLIIYCKLIDGINSGDITVKRL